MISARCSQGRYFSSAWNYVDLFSILCYTVCAILWLKLLIVAGNTDVPAAFDLTTNEDQMKLVELTVTLDNAVSYVKQYTLFTSKWW